VYELNISDGQVVQEVASIQQVSIGHPSRVGQAPVVAYGKFEILFTNANGTH
jgi:hypothetical protein